MDVTINVKVEILTFVLLPSSIRILLEMDQTKGIIPTELLNKYSKTLSNLRKILVLKLSNDNESFDEHHNLDNQLLQSQENLTFVQELSLD